MRRCRKFNRVGVVSQKAARTSAGLEEGAVVEIALEYCSAVKNGAGVLSETLVSHHVCISRRVAGSTPRVGGGHVPHRGLHPAARAACCAGDWPR